MIQLPVAQTLMHGQHQHAPAELVRAAGIHAGDEIFPVHTNADAFQLQLSADFVAFVHEQREAERTRTIGQLFDHRLPAVILGKRVEQPREVCTTLSNDPTRIDQGSQPRERSN